MIIFLSCSWKHNNKRWSWIKVEMNVPLRNVTCRHLTAATFFNKTVTGKSFISSFSTSGRIPKCFLKCVDCALKLQSPHSYDGTRPFQMTEWAWRARAREAVRWVTATWELPLTAHLDGLCIGKRAKKIKTRQPCSLSPFFSPPTDP